MENHRGYIVGIGGHPMSGLWQLRLEPSDLESPVSVYIESGTGVRALAAAFGATEAAGDLQDKIKGQAIVFSVDHMGILEGFTPAADWDEAEYQREEYANEVAYGEHAEVESPEIEEEGDDA